MARKIKERHNATPYGFYFTTRERKDNDLDSREVKRSGTYFLGGNVETLADVEKRNDPEESILRSNMKCKNGTRFITNNNSWKITQPLLKGDTVLIFRYAMLPIAAPFIFIMWLIQACITGIMEMSITGDSPKEWINEYLYG